MSKISHNLFLLMLNLSQLDSEELVKELFLEAVSEWTGDKNIRYGSGQECDKGFAVEIATQEGILDCILFNETVPEDENFMFLMKNAANTLAVILDSLRNKKAYEHEKKILEAMVHKRTEEMKKINSELMAEIMERELYEQQLAENENKFRMLVENINDVLFTLDDNGIITYISPVIKKISGYAPEEITGKNCIIFIHKNDRDRIENNLANPGNSDHFETKFRIISKKGKTRWARISLRLITDGTSEKGYRGLLTDITEVKERNEIAELIARNIDDVLWVINAEDNSLSYISPSYERVWGYSINELYENTGSFINSVHPEDRPKISAGLDTNKDAGFFDDECRIIRSDGEIRWMWIKAFTLKNAENEIINRIGLARDITEKKQNELMYSAIIQTSLEGFYLINSRADILEANSAACSMTGYTRDELLKMNLSMIEARLGSEQIAKILAEIENRGWGRFESRHRAKSGKVIDVGISINCFPAEKGKFVVFIRDNTEKKQLENQIVQSQKMESIGLLAAGIAHDFNNLLSPILGYTEMMMLSLKDENENENFPMLNEVKRAAERSKDLIKQLMAFSRRQEIESKNTSLANIVDGIYRILRRTLRENIEIEVRHSMPKASVIADVGKIEQVIMNLAINAHDAMPDGGRLLIKTGMAVIDESSSLKTPDIKPGSYAILEMSDTGCGMDGETMKRIFEPFYTKKEVGKGTGLGLATVYGIASGHGGGISVQSEPEKGSAFTLYIPTAEVPDKKHETDQMLQSDCRKSGITASASVLLVEDEEITRKTALNIIRRIGYNVICASNGEECLRLMENRQLSEKIDVIVSDVIMPDIKGTELFRILRKTNPKLKAVFMSGYPEESMDDYGFSKNDFDFIQKPFSVKELAMKLENILKKN